MRLSNNELQHLLSQTMAHCGLKERDVSMCLLFGSVARGSANEKSDVDAIYLIKDGLNLSFEFKRTNKYRMQVDANRISFEQLDERSQDPNWAYRLYGARAVKELCSENMGAVQHWLTLVNTIITSDEAFTHRASQHILDIEALIRLIDRSEKELEVTRFYLLAELLGVIPLAILNLYSIMPFQGQNPGAVCSNLTKKRDDGVSRAYHAVINGVRDVLCFQDPDTGMWSAEKTRLIRKEFHDCTAKCSSRFSGRDYRALFEDGGAALPMLEKAFRERQMPHWTISGDFRRLVNRLVNQMQQKLSAVKMESKHVAKRQPPELPAVRETGSRLIVYDRERKRLKGILPTGGCRVPGCSFCMLPVLARAKGSVSEFVSRMMQAATGPVESVSVYTDGSYFDDREIDSKERIIIERMVSDLGASEFVVESLPRFATRPHIHATQRSLGSGVSLRIAVGYQSSRDDVRKYITMTPIAKREFDSLIARRSGESEFGLRVYLLLGKPLMSRWEDQADVINSLDSIAHRLGPNDIVTINPLLPTRGTLVHRLERSGLFSPITEKEFSKFATDLKRSSYVFHLEFGQFRGASCSDIDVSSPADKSINFPAFSIGAREIPWNLLGGYESRLTWALRIVRNLGNSEISR